LIPELVEQNTGNFEMRSCQVGDTIGTVIPLLEYGTEVPFVNDEIAVLL
jgi:hypothetical protein